MSAATSAKPSSTRRSGCGICPRNTCSCAEVTWDYTELLELQLRQHYEEFLLYSGRKTALGEQLVSLLDRLREKDPKVPKPTPGVISPKNLARLIGETGPITDFANWRMLLRYAGLNIQMRQSGQYRGQYRISKKGRPLLRKILALVVLPLVRRKCLYGPYYHRKRKTMRAEGHGRRHAALPTQVPRLVSIRTGL